MRKMTSNLLLFFLVFDLFFRISNAQEWERYTTANGLVGNSVSLIKEDRKGYLWYITMFNGASYYDGRSFQPLNTTNGLVSNNIYFTLADTKGNVWFATDRGVSVYDGTQCQEFDTTHGLADNSVTYILEDSEGNLWFGTENGLSRYNGKNFESYDVTHGLSDNSITCIHVDRNGIFWFGTGKGVTKYDGEKFQRLSTTHLSDPIQVIYEDRDGNLWFGSERGIFKKSVNSLRIEGPLVDANVLSIEEDHLNNLWFATDNKGVIKVDYDKKKNFVTQYELIDRSILSILEDSRVNFWFGTDRGIYKYDGTTFQHIMEINGSPLNFVENILEDSDENLWFATGNGVFKHTVEPLHSFKEADGLVDNSIKALVEDAEGNLWFGTENGVSKYDGEGFQNFTLQNGDNHILSMIQDRNNDLWFGTSSGIYKYSKSGFRRYSELNTAVYFIREDRKGNIWFGTEDGIRRYDGRSFKSLPIDGVISEMYIDNSDNLWIGTLNNGLYKHGPGETQTHLTMKDGLLSNNVRWILQDYDGYLWFGLQGELSQIDSENVARSGICCYDGKSYKSFSSEDGLLSDDIMVAEEDRNGNLWFGTDAGIMKCYKLPGDTTFSFSPYKEEDDLISNYVTAIRTDRSGNLWFGTNRGISKYDGENFQSIPLEKYLTFGLGDITKIYEDKSDALWFITENNGVIRYIPPRKEIHPRIHMTQIEADKIYKNVDEIRIPTTAKRITFEYKGISFISTPEQIRYKYILEGHDPERHQSVGTRVSYENLRPGDYQFKVAAIDKDLHESDPWAAVTIHVFRPFNRSAFFLLMVVLMGICFVGGSSYLTVQLRRQRLKAAKFRELLRMQAETERIQMAKMESLRQLIAGVAHEMNNPIGVISSSNDASSRAIGKIDRIISEELPDKIKKDMPLKKTLDVLKNTNQTSKAASERVAKIVTNLRRFVRLDEGEWQAADIHEALDSVITLLEPEMGERITVRKNYGDLPQVYSCPSNLNQVFMAILRNASDAIDEKGEIEVRTTVQRDRIKIEISDDGVGIPPENIERIFDPGFTTKGVKVGVGLGLAICHKIIVDEHKGRIDVSSEPGKGTTVTIILPQKTLNNDME